MTEVVENTQQKMVTLTIDEIEVTVPEGTMVVDAAKKIGVNIPVFCYHPKMEPVGMCRVCMVDIGMPVRDRATGQVELDESGQPKIQFGRTLQAGCTVAVAEGMVVVGYTAEVKKARQDILEFLLTSHPLDCPVCDKGGECPLQNLTMAWGTGESRFKFDEKLHLGKNVPLGELIYLDQERCIQCARCIRFQRDIADDAVLGFDERGRKTQIVTLSEPGFDSYWSGNTTDICPVGALTTADFRFGARPWELKASASVCNHCPVGCNLTVNTRREAKAGGGIVIKRIMPRQNEQVNELWICDKGRFAYDYTDPITRLDTPLVRKDGELVEVEWEEALTLVAEKFKAAGADLLAVASGRLSNEDFYALHKLSTHLGGKARLYSQMGGGELAAQVGLAAGSNLSDLGKGDVILVAACDLEEEAPLWWLRVKQAAERGATLIVANPRRTKLDRVAAYSLRYSYGQEADTVLALADGKDEASKAWAAANNAVVLFGSEGTSLAASEQLAAACANLLVKGGYVGKPNNGLIPVWDGGNVQGAWDAGLRPSQTLAAELKAAKAAYLVAADLASDDPALAEALKAAEFVVVQELHRTATAEMADVVLPVLAFTERDGSYTSGERRVQRYYPVLPPVPGLQPDYGVVVDLAAELDLALGGYAASLFEELAAENSAYADLDYEKLAEVVEQWPIVGRDDLYYGGTGYQNTQGLGVKLANVGAAALADVKAAAPAKADGLQAVPITVLYDAGNTVADAEVLGPRLTKLFVSLHPADAEGLKLAADAVVMVALNGVNAEAAVVLDDSQPQGFVLVPRSLGMPISGPTPVAIKAK